MCQGESFLSVTATLGVNTDLNINLDMVLVPK